MVSWGGVRMTVGGSSNYLETWSYDSHGVSYITETVTEANGH